MSGAGGAAPPRRVRLELAYDGTEFAGWQRQPGRRTVQGVLEAALGRLQGGRPARVRGAGRTDAGVHALGQVADGLVATRLDDAALAHALRRMLPADLRPVRLATVAEAFDARRHARSKTYRYRLDLSAHGDPFRARFALHWRHGFRADPVREALSRLEGRHDWSGFADSACTVRDRVRTLHAARLERSGAVRAALEFRANGFLHHMVRNLVGTLLEIGRGRMGPEQVGRILEAGDRRLAGPTAPARGLRLERVDYDGEEAGAEAAGDA